MKLSVIVPVYNVERFLPRCLDSLLRQGLNTDDYEVICVNDGSLDNSAQILAEYEQKHPEIIRVITQENKGLGGARNTGTAQAKGEYIVYLDSDDYVVDEGYAQLLNTIETEQAQTQGRKLPDIVYFHSTNVVTDGIERAKSEAPKQPISVIGRDNIKRWRSHILGYAWNKFYRRAFLEEHNCRFKDGICEDELFNYELFLHAPHFLVTDANIYRFEQNNPKSILHTNDHSRQRKQMTDLENVIGIMNGYLIAHSNDDFAMGVKQSNCRLLKTYHKKAYKAHLSHSEWRNHMKKLREYPYCKMGTEGSAMGKLVAVLNNHSLNSYGMYVFVSFFYERLFERFVRPHFITKTNTSYLLS